MFDAGVGGGILYRQPHVAQLVTDGVSGAPVLRGASGGAGLEDLLGGFVNIVSRIARKASGCLLYTS